MSLALSVDSRFPLIVRHEGEIVPMMYIVSMVLRKAILCTREHELNLAYEGAIIFMATIEVANFW